MEFARSAKALKIPYRSEHDARIRAAMEAIAAQTDFGIRVSEARRRVERRLRQLQLTPSERQAAEFLYGAWMLTQEADISPVEGGAQQGTPLWIRKILPSKLPVPWDLPAVLTEKSVSTMLRPDFPQVQVTMVASDPKTFGRGFHVSVEDGPDTVATGWGTTREEALRHVLLFETIQRETWRRRLTTLGGRGFKDFYLGRG